MDRVIQKNQIPSYVIAGKMLQLRLPKAVEYMVKGNEWCTCDIISERVFGVGLLENFDDALEKLSHYIGHGNKWIRRALGTAVHLAVK